MGRGVVGAKWTKRSNVWLLELSGVMTGVMTGPAMYARMLFIAKHTVVKDKLICYKSL